MKLISFYSICLIFLIKNLVFLRNVLANEILGCGGFIKSHTDIDFSKVEIKLLTKQGLLKDKTDCSPSNGYYFLPIYDKGEYILRISPPGGWSFEPEQVELNFDGKTDICSRGKDVNFVFKGFGITGKVVLAGTNRIGARGVNVELESANEKIQTTTDVNGIFSFTPIIPGKYIIRATHPKWHFSSAQHEVVVVSGNTELPENALVVSGFDVNGRFDTSDQIISEIGIALFRKKGEDLPLKCPNGLPVTLRTGNSNYESSSACHIQIEKSGEYTLRGIAPGQYLIQPVIENPNLNLHIVPSSIEFEVLRDTLDLKKQFKIEGFSVVGKVLTSYGGKPVANAVIKLDGKIVTKTDTDGKYSLENVQTGSYTLHVESPQLQFQEQRIKLEMSTPTLPDITPSSYQVCGKIISEKSYTVGFTKQGSTFHTTTTSKTGTGDWCLFLPNGKFTVEVLTTDADKSSGIKFFPLQENIEIKSEPLSGITFSQLRATVNGELVCLSDAPLSCFAAEVTLHSLDPTGQPTGQKQTTKAKNGKYSFNEVLPGPYEITIQQSNLCFDTTRVLINVASTVESAPQFTQRGYEISIISSHRSIMKYTYVNNEETPSATETMKLLAGVNTFCVLNYGTYNIKLEGCHLFDEDFPKTFSTVDTNPIIINAVAHKIGVRILSPDPSEESLQLQVESSSIGKQIVKPIPEAHKVDGKYAYRYDTYLKPNSVLHVTPKSDILLFTPQTKDIIGSNDCVDIAFNFVATRGLILQGKVVPPIKDARITLSFPNNPELAEQTIITTITGEFKFNPIEENLRYELNAEKESYFFSPYNPQSATFTAHKLCEIIVKVKDGAEAGTGLSGVLVSLSGAESYRKNLVTGEDGVINFHSLSPSQYFLRPMMKEYKFEPNSKMIDIKDGETVEVDLVGKRVAYSVFGTITSLNGDPFGQVNLEATADEECMHHQEEATSESNGRYRLRGLQPGCTYTIRSKDASHPHSNVERTIPSSHIVKIANENIHNINLIATSQINFVDVTARVTAALNDHYKTLRIVMYRRGESDSPIYLQRVETPLNPKSKYNPGIMVFFPRIPLDSRTYIVELRSTLSEKTYSYTLATAQFVANRSSIYVELDFNPEVRTTEADLNQNSISALFLVTLVAIAFFKQDIAMDFLNFIWSKLNNIATEFTQKQKNNSKKENRKNEPINQKEIEQMAEQINAIKKKKTKKI